MGKSLLQCSYVLLTCSQNITLVLQNNNQDYTINTTSISYPVQNLCSIFSIHYSNLTNRITTLLVFLSDLTTIITIVTNLCHLAT